MRSQTRVSILVALLVISGGCIEMPRNYGTIWQPNISPVYPTMNYSYENRYKTIDSLQPELKWNGVIKTNQTYEVCIWETPYRSAKDVKAKAAQKQANWGVSIYFTNNISGNFHQVALQLKPDTYYNWSVRIRDGEKVSAWGTFSQIESDVFTVKDRYNNPFGFKTPSQPGLPSAQGDKTASASIEEKQIPVNLSQYRTIAVAVSSKDPDFDRTELGTLAFSTINKLIGSGKFDKVYATSTGDAQNADLILSVKVNLFVNGAQYSPLYRNRSGSIDASITLTNASDGKMLATTDLHAQTGSGSPLGIGPDNLDLNQLLARQIANFVAVPNTSDRVEKKHVTYSMYRACLPALTTNEARIWFYRPHSIYAFAVNPTVMVDGTYAGSAFNGTFFCVTVAPGSHNITNIPPENRTTHSTVDVSGGSETYVRVHLKAAQESAEKGIAEISGLTLSGE